MKWGNIQQNVNPISIVEDNVQSSKPSVLFRNNPLFIVNEHKIKHKTRKDRNSKDFDDKTDIFNEGEKVNNPSKTAASMHQQKHNRNFVRSDISDIVMDVENLPKENGAQNIRVIDNSVDDTSNASDENVCVKKVMQIAETVYEDRVVCHHTVSEKCHQTFLTEYVPTLEKKCMTSYQKKCNIQYKPTVHTETVRICRAPLQAVCSNNTVGEVVCRTHYETECQTRYKEIEVEEDNPVCKIVTERKCHDDEGSSGLHDQDIETEEDIRAQLLGLEEKKCTEWPVKKCTLEKVFVTRTNPETSCSKISRNMCAASNCVLEKSEEKCQDESHNSVLNIPTESCDLEPQEDCNMETVLVPRLVQKPRCLRVPKEVCVNTKGNPRKVLKPVVKEWCYKPSELKQFSRKKYYANLLRTKQIG